VCQNVHHIARGSILEQELPEKNDRRYFNWETATWGKWQI
jgi:hypothetical protein